MKIYFQSVSNKRNANFTASEETRAKMRFDACLQNYPDISKIYFDLVTYMHKNNDKAGIIYKTKLKNLHILLRKNGVGELIPYVDKNIDSITFSKKEGNILNDDPWHPLSNIPLEMNEIISRDFKTPEELNRDAQKIIKSIEKIEDKTNTHQGKPFVAYYVDPMPVIHMLNDYYHGLSETQKNIIRASEAVSLDMFSPKEIKTRDDLQIYMIHYAKQNISQVNSMLDKYDMLVLTDKVYEYLVVKHLIEQNEKINKELAQAVTSYMKNTITKKLGNPRQDSITMKKEGNYDKAVGTVFRYFLTDLLKFEGLSFEGIKMNYPQLKENSQISLAAAARAKGVNINDKEILFYYKTVGRILKNLNIPFDENEYLDDLRKRISRFQASPDLKAQV